MSTLTVEIGQPAPDFTLPASNGSQVSLSDFRGKYVVLYFYPRDNTPGCTQEAQDFRDAMEAFQARDAVIVGVSPDPLPSHEKFIAKHDLPFLLLSDVEHKAAEMYGVWQLKKMAGKEYYGVVRSTFLIDPQGRLAREWRNVRVKGHVQDVLQALDERYKQERCTRQDEH
ncbi:MAG: peroxiredoxin [Bacillus thermozeamaize]|uniref:thioredoxin-dependent peroxiredoxin n=1 Tax=Bacillus thermozeamaize TaxID=230954 RepID=A0A1Y3PSN1_9BACI|nr:MAG: peroxiredoxin [Bacillus thermozeamaize]